MTNKKFFCLLFLISHLFIFADSVKKSEPGITSLNHFRKIVILENGRKKPLDTYAQNILKQFSGRGKLNRKPAIHWLASVLLTPQNSYDDKVFLVNNPDVLHSLGMMQIAKKRDRYSYNQLKEYIPKLQSLAFSALKMEKKERTMVENEIILLYSNLYRYTQLISNFQFLMPHKDFSIEDTKTRKYLGLDGNRSFFSLFELIEKKEKIQKILDERLGMKKEDLSSLEKEIFNIHKKIEEWGTLYQKLPLTIIPVVQNGEERWMSSWDFLFNSYIHRSPIPEEVSLIRDIVSDYFKNDQEKFDRTVRSFNKLILNQSKGTVRKYKISTEILYNKVNPLYRSKFLYGFSLLFLLFSFLFLKKWFYRFSVLFLSMGFILHTSGILMRMIIRGRPPVTNLYETFVFTGWIAVLIGVILEFYKKKNIGILTSGFCGLVMLLIAGKYALEGDTMGMLVAVLNTNFWLAVHIITITVGFAGIVVSGVIGHVYVVQKMLKAEKKDLLKNTFQAIYSTQAFGLIFTFVGTVLGGMWADQSWGRFWGWDPKENGALIIILWSAFLFHARLAGWIKELGMALGSIGGIITVVLTWFGINLLGVGLHAYGFTTGLATGLMIFVGFEIVFILCANFYIKKIKPY